MQAFPFDSELTFDDHDNPIYDRAVSSQPLRKLIKELFTTGVMPNPSSNLQVSAGSDGMTVQVSAGFAVVDGGLCQETETRTLEVTAADNTYDRIDTVVLRWNENVDVRTADLYVVAGTPAVNPVRPTLQRNNSVYEIGLADIFITKRIATITNDKITDTRYEAERCGVVSSVSEWDTTSIYQQVQADLVGFKTNEQATFMVWFETIRNILDDDSAGHLQNEIDSISEDITDLHERVDECFQSASEGKTLIASTLTGKGQTSTSADTFAQMAAKINNLMAVPTATKSITANGSNIDVLNYAKVNVSVPDSHNCFFGSTSVNFNNSATINCGFYPKYVICALACSGRGTGWAYINNRGSYVCRWTSSVGSYFGTGIDMTYYIAITLSSNGFTVTNKTNENATVYYLAAL